MLKRQSAHTKPASTRASEVKRAARSSAAAGDAHGQISSGNVFADLGFDDPETELLKADLVIALGDVIKRNGLTQTAAAERLGTTQPKMSLLLRGRTQNVSAEKLMEYLTLMDRQVHIVVTPAAQQGARRSPPKVIMAPQPWQQTWLGRASSAPARPGQMLYAAKKTQDAVKGGLRETSQIVRRKGQYTAAKSSGKPAPGAKPTRAR